MQAVAAENNLSETAFLVPEGEGFRLRWFTPTTEVDLCGHATLASAFVVFGWLAPWRRSVTFRPRRRPLTVTRAATSGARFPVPPGAAAGRSRMAAAAALGRAPTGCCCPRPGRNLRAMPRRCGAEPGSGGAGRNRRSAVIVHRAGYGRDRFRVALLSRRARRRRPGHRLGALHADPVVGGAARQDAAEARQLSRRGGRLCCELRGERVTSAAARPAT